jgi:hypothetical protein
MTTTPSSKTEMCRECEHDCPCCEESCEDKAPHKLGDHFPGGCRHGGTPSTETEKLLLDIDVVRLLSYIEELSTENKQLKASANYKMISELHKRNEVLVEKFKAMHDRYCAHFCYPIRPKHVQACQEAQDAISSSLSE